MICKKCGHDVDKYEVIYVGGWRKLDRRFKSNPVPYCPCGAKLLVTSDILEQTKRERKTSNHS